MKNNLSLSSYAGVSKSPADGQRAVPSREKRRLVRESSMSQKVEISERQTSAPEGRPVCIIPARGGSKRLHKKNLAMLGGKPLIARTIEAALASKIFDHVYVSTEDEEIRAAAEHFGAEVPYRRSASLAADDVGSPRVAADLVEFLGLHGNHYDVVCLAEPVVPFFTAEDFRQAYALFVDKDVPVLHTVTTFPEPPQWALREENGIFSPMYGSRYHLQESQELEPAFMVLGIVFVRSSHLLESRSAIASEMAGYIIQRKQAITIHTYEDLVLADCRLKGLLA